MAFWQMFVQVCVYVCMGRSDHSWAFGVLSSNPRVVLHLVCRLARWFLTLTSLPSVKSTLHYSSKCFVKTVALLGSI